MHYCILSIALRNVIHCLFFTFFLNFLLLVCIVAVKRTHWKQYRLLNWITSLWSEYDSNMYSEIYTCIGLFRIEAIQSRPDCTFDWVEEVIETESENVNLPTWGHHDDYTAFIRNTDPLQMTPSVCTMSVRLSILILPTLYRLLYKPAGTPSRLSIHLLFSSLLLWRFPVHRQGTKNVLFSRANVNMAMAKGWGVCVWN